MSRPPVESPTAAPPSRPAAPGVTSRRAFLRLGSLAAAGTVAGAAEGAAQAPRAATPAAQPPKRIRAPRLAKRFAGVNQAAQPSWLIDPVDSWATRSVRLARRITLGVTQQEAQRAIELDYYGYLDSQLEYDRIDDSAVEEVVATRYPLLSRSAAQLAADSAGYLQQLQDATLHRAAFSPRQLYERMVEFWTDHFTIYAPKVGFLKIIDDRDVIRRHALGTFPELLRASAKSPAMLVYLDQQTSRRQAPNQNYPRELLELHTMGVDGGYTQQDVAELSRALTGWSITGRTADFFFNATYHDYGEKTILGHRIAAMPASAGAQGIRDGETILELLIDHPSTARFISTKLLRWLLWYDPTPEMVDRVAEVYTSTRGDIKSMVRACLDPSYLVQAPAKLKRPFHFLASALRGLGPLATVNRVATLSRQLTTLGQPLFLWETPDGYPDHVDYWAGNVLPRWNAAVTLANASSSSDIILDVTPLMRLGTAEAVVAEIGRSLFGDELSTRTREELVAYLRSAPTNATRIRETIALAISSSEFQWY
jgi:uncharacterized protein (DUF1800 family)